VAGTLIGDILGKHGLGQYGADLGKNAAQGLADSGIHFAMPATPEFADPLGATAKPTQPTPAASTATVGGSGDTGSTESADSSKVTSKMRDETKTSLKEMGYSPEEADAIIAQADSKAKDSSEFESIIGEVPTKKDNDNWANEFAEFTARRLQDKDSTEAQKIADDKVGGVTRSLKVKNERRSGMKRYFSTGDDFPGIPKGSEIYYHKRGGNYTWYDQNGNELDVTSPDKPSKNTQEIEIKVPVKPDADGKNAKELMKMMGVKLTPPKPKVTVSDKEMEDAKDEWNDHKLGDHFTYEVVGDTVQIKLKPGMKAADVRAAFNGDMKDGFGDFFGDLPDKIKTIDFCGHSIPNTGDPEDEVEKVMKDNSKQLGGNDFTAFNTSWASSPMNRYFEVEQLPGGKLKVKPHSRLQTPAKKDVLKNSFTHSNDMRDALHKEFAKLPASAVIEFEGEGYTRDTAADQIKNKTLGQPTVTVQDASLTPLGSGFMSAYRQLNALIQCTYDPSTGELTIVPKPGMEGDVRDMLKSRRASKPFIAMLKAIKGKVKPDKVVYNGAGDVKNVVVSFADLVLR